MKFHARVKALAVGVSDDRSGINLASNILIDLGFAMKYADREDVAMLQSELASAAACSHHLRKQLKKHASISTVDYCTGIDSMTNLEALVETMKELTDFIDNFLSSKNKKVSKWSRRSSKIVAADSIVVVHLMIMELGAKVNKQAKKQQSKA